MTRRILKYYLRVERQQQLVVPFDAQVIEVHEQQGFVALWVLTSGRKSTKTLDVTCVNTGEPIPDDAGDYIGTAHIHLGRTVVHVFAKEQP